MGPPRSWLHRLGSTAFAFSLSLVFLFFPLVWDTGLPRVEPQPSFEAAYQRIADAQEHPFWWVARVLAPLSPWMILAAIAFTEALRSPGDTLTYRSVFWGFDFMLVIMAAHIMGSELVPIFVFFALFAVVPVLALFPQRRPASRQDVLSAAGFELYFFNAHRSGPPEVRVERGPRTAVFRLDPVTFAWNSGFGASELIQVEALVRERADSLLEAWNG